MRKLLIFFNPIENFWPWVLPLSDVHLIASHFDHSPLSDAEFARYGVPLPSNIQRAAHKRRAEFLAGRLCAQQALLMLNGVGSIPGIKQDRAPQWPQGCVGSITHSDTWAAAVVADNDQYIALGLDIEPCLSHRDSRKLANGILTTGEQSRWAQLPSEQFSLMVTLTFSLKESLFKALHPLVSTGFYFEHAELLDWNMATGTARLRLLKDLNNEWLTGRELEAQFCLMDKHMMSLIAVPRPRRQVQA